MVRPKANSKKKQQRGVDFKKIKRKLGRKLPPPKNATNTEVKSKAIILPEQSVASEKAGLAVSKKGLTLKELLQQTSHHNPKVRRDALAGIKDLFLKHPEELRSHKYIVMEKLRERISDTDKVVRESLYQLLKSVIFPACKEDNQGPLIALMMAYIFNAMTNLAIDVQLMAFKFFDLVIQYHPPSFSVYAEKILQNYENILRTSQVYLQDKGKLKNALGGLVHCLSLLPCDKREVDSSEEDIAGQNVLHAFECDEPTEPAGCSLIVNKLKDLVPILVNCFQVFVPLAHAMPVHDALSFDCMLGLLQSIDLAVRYLIDGMQRRQLEAQPPYGGDDATICDQIISSVLLKKLLAVFPLNPSNNLSEKADDRYFILNIVSTEIFLHLCDRICPPAVLLGRFLEFIENALLGKICSGTRSSKAVREKHILSIIPFIPKLVSRVAGDWKFRLLQAFTDSFMGCHAESSLKLACLSAIRQMLIPGKDMLCLANDPDLIDHQIAWVEVLPLLLNLLGDKHPSRSQVVLHLILRLGQYALLNPSLTWAFDNIQNSLCEFYSTRGDEGDINYGPFIRLPRDSQELAVCCLYYFSNLDSQLLTSIACCCLCHDLEPLVLFRIIEVLHSAYKSAHIQIADHISFFITLLARFRVFPDNIYPVIESNANISNREFFKSVTSRVCSYMSEIGDKSLVFQMVEKIVIGQISLKPALDNVCAMLRMLIMLDSKPTKLAEQNIITLSNFLSGYLMDVVHCFPEDTDESSLSIRLRTRRYYFLPGLFLFDRSQKLLKLALSTMESLIADCSALVYSRNYSQFATDVPNRINAIVSVLLLICKDAKVQRVIASFTDEIDRVSQGINRLQSSKEINMTIEEKHKVQCAFDLLEIARSVLPNKTLPI